MADLVALVAGKKITDKNAIEVLRVMLDEIAENRPAEMPRAIAARLDLGVTGGGLVHGRDFVGRISENPRRSRLPCRERTGLSCSWSAR